MKYESYVLQDRGEILQFIDLLKKENVRSYLEIGCKFGGSLWLIGNSLPKGSRIVAVDLPHGDTSFKDTLPHLKQCVDVLKQKGYDAHLIVGDSTSADVIEKVFALGPFDATFIDANHTVTYVMSDWSNYGRVSRIVAFHDINFYRPGGLPPHKKPIEVPQVWSKVRENHKFVEIINRVTDPNGARHNGIGVLWTK